MGMTTDGIVLENHGAIARLRLSRAEKKNAVTAAMWSFIAEQTARLAADGSTRVLIVEGDGADFCAGADIAEFDTVRKDADTARAYEALNTKAFAALRMAPFPVIASITGICFGGGFGIAAAADLRLATPDAIFSVPAARLGLAYPQQAMTDIVTAAGAQMAKYLTFTAGRINVLQARDAGFLLEIAADRDHLAVRVDEIAAAIAGNAPISVRASKAAINAEANGEAADAERARELGDLTFDSADYAEGRAAFREKRRPVFSGR